jgi:hypothetical protein
MRAANGIGVITRPETADATSTGFLNGSKLYHRRARRVLPVLVRQAKAQKPMFYSEVAAEVGIPNPRNLDYVLGAIANEMKRTSKPGFAVPPIQFLVINKGTNLPGTGVAGFAPNPAIFRNASPQQKSRIFNLLLEEVFAFKKWDKVMELCNIRAVAHNVHVAAPAVREGAGGWGGGGEGEDHRLLKEHIAAHPEVVGLPKGSSGHTEFTFLTGDALDILFECGDEWIGVEVKGARSNDDDVVRGMFQCAKYTSLLEAHQKYEQRRVHARVMLALGRDFPGAILWLKHALGTDIVRVSLPASLTATTAI